MGHLEASWGRLGDILGRLGTLLGVSWEPLGYVLGPLGGQDPPETKGRRVFEASWGRLGLIFGTFWDGFWDEFSILFLSYHSKYQHVVKPQNYYKRGTGEPLEAFQVEYF